MIDQSLINYIQEASKQGMTKEMITQELIKIGWDSTMVDDGIKSFNNEIPASSPTVIKTKSTYIKPLLIGGSIFIILGLAYLGYTLYNRYNSVASEQLSSLNDKTPQTNIPSENKELIVNEENSEDKKDDTEELIVNNNPSCPSIVEYEGGGYDIKGNLSTTGGYYRTVKIGDQCWLKENLNVGTMIKESVIPTDNKITEKYCFDYNPSNCDIYGGLYLGVEAIQYIKGDINTDDPKTNKLVRGICPTGWHIPSDNEFAILADYLGGAGIAGGKLKESGTTHWRETSKDVTNSSGFTALPAGFTYSHGYQYLGTLLDLWTSTVTGYSMQARGLVMYNLEFKQQYNNQYGNGNAIRCLKD